MRDTVKSFSNKIGESALLRFALVGFMILLLQIPLEMVDSLTYERADQESEARSRVAAAWGGPQTVKGPLLVVPYSVARWRTDWEKDKKGKAVEVQYKLPSETRLRVFLPKDLEIKGEIKTEERYYGIYTRVVYYAPLSLDGYFSLPQPADFGCGEDAPEEIFWDKAWISIGISDLPGVKKADLALNGQKLVARPGTEADAILASGLHAIAPLDPQKKEQSFSVQLGLNGSAAIYFAPVGEANRISLHGAWPAPGFGGSFLPRERAIADDGFSAKWEISNLARPYPQFGPLEVKAFPGLHNSAPDYTAALAIVEPVSLYRVLERAMNHGILFITLTFAAFFVFELVRKARLHLAQYFLVGLSMVVFYLTLLSLSEHVAFALSFAAASSITIGMIACYIGAALRSFKSGLGMAGLLGLLYASLYALLHLEDMALLLGTGLVLLAVGALMFATRKLPVRSLQPAEKEENILTEEEENVV